MKTKTSILALIKAFFILLVMCCFSSCAEPKAPTKPFIIKFKYPNSSRAADGYCRYEYYDKNGTTFEFFDLPDKYNVGDTIK
jgi:hypothetical protein